jgi:hypothetical protein
VVVSQVDKVVSPGTGTGTPSTDKTTARFVEPTIAGVSKVATETSANIIYHILNEKSKFLHITFIFQIHA